MNLLNQSLFKFSISLKIFLGYFVLVGLAGWFVLNVFMQEVKPGVRQAMEDTLVDTANMLAALASNDMQNNHIATGQFANSLAQYQQQITQSNIWGITKAHREYRVYITDTNGIVVFDSSQLALGQDYSQWNDVYLTLRGKYGARSSAVIKGQPDGDTIMYVAAPIKHNNAIIGSLTVAKPNSSMSPFIDRAQSQILQRGIVLLVLSLLIGAFFTWRFTRKINKLREYATQVSQGNKATAPDSSNDELAELALAMQTMRIELDGKQYVQASVEHLTHELKSPITAIQGALELLSPQMPKDKQTKFINQMKAQTERIKTIVQNLLGLAALEHQQTLKQTSTIELKALVQTQIEHLMVKASEANISISFEGEDQQTQGDHFLLGQAIYNLLENALDFSPAGSEIMVKLSNTEQATTLTVTDTGTGIPEYALSKIFDKFYSLPRPNNQQKSTGLGLNFVQEVTKLHNGTIQLENMASGGVTATLSLPL